MKNVPGKKLISRLRKSSFCKLKLKYDILHVRQITPFCDKLCIGQRCVIEIRNIQINIQSENS